MDGGALGGECLPVGQQGLAALVATRSGSFEIELDGQKNHVFVQSIMDQWTVVIVISNRELLAEVEKRRPMTETETLQRELARAIELENYERAAQLRDKLKGLKGFGHTVRGGAKKRPRAGGGGSGE